MKIGITGSRNVTKKELVYFILKHVCNTYKLKPTALKSGGANGVDKIAEEFFKQYFDINAQVLKPDYEAFKGRERLAPLARNGDIVKDNDYVIAIWAGETPEGKGGTWDATKKAIAMQIPVIFVNVKRGTIELK